MFLLPSVAVMPRVQLKCCVMVMAYPFMAIG
jgi:hypothetical protein